MMIFFRKTEHVAEVFEHLEKILVMLPMSVMIQTKQMSDWLVGCFGFRAL